MATAGTNITSIAKPGIGTTTGPQWATDLNTSLDAVDGHDHSTNKGVRITPAGVNINADLEFNQNSATELKNVIFDSSVTAATTAYSVYQASGNLYWRNGSGTAVQITTGSSVNAGAGSISGMTSTDAGVTYADGSKTFNFFTDSGNEDYGKMAHADLLLFKYTNDNSADTDYVTIAANAGVSGSSGTIYVPSENGTFLTTNTSYATSAINVATSASNYPINLKPHGTGHVVVGNGGATGKLTSNGAYDLILDTNSGTNSSSIAITDAANGDIKFIPNGTGEIVIGSGSASGKITSSGAHDLVLDTNAGTNSGSITITDAANGNIDITPNGTGEVNISKVDIDAGAIDGTTIGASSQAAGDFTAIGAVAAGTIVGTTIDATTDFTIGGTVITDGNIADTGTLALVPVDGCTIALGSDAGDDFNIDGGKLVVEGDTGRCGIGTATPDERLHVMESEVSGATAHSESSIVAERSGNNFMSVLSSSNSGVLFGDAGGNEIGRIIYNHGSDYMHFYTNNTEKMRINSSGNVLIGTADTGEFTGGKRIHCYVNDSTDYDAANAATWATTLIQNGAADYQDHAAGIGFSTVATAQYDNNAVCGIAAVKQDGNAYGADLVFITRPGAAVSAERMRIDSSGNVGINIDDPAYPLTVNTGVGGYAYFGGTSDRGVRIGNLAGYADIQGWSQGSGVAKDLSLQKSGGSVGIGTDSPSQPLSVHYTSAGTTTPGMRIEDSTDRGNQRFLILVNSTGDLGGIQGSGTSAAVALFNSSDRRIKTNIVDSEPILSKLCQVRVADYNMKTDKPLADKSQGVIAQELYEIFPEMVTKTDDGTGEDLPEGVERWSVIQDWNFKLIKAIQELSAKVTALENA